ncbi:hypothetical protein FJZ18_02570 [Candidatus Pacearchaeota archaeon]|nr:hypothetical protein [Candidatus Pacearchaeota archaeon]
MKIAVVGKGGSGKSSIAWLLSMHASQKKNVLAIDADYNMDLATNLQWNPAMPTKYLNHAEGDFYAYQGLSELDYYVDLPEKNLKEFSLSPPDQFTKKYAHSLSHQLSLMVFGGLHEDLLYGHRCSHAYISALKYYLPLLKIKENEVVVVDSVAGIDMVGYGLYLGVDALIIVTEPTENSKKVAAQIKVIADEFGIPSIQIRNKEQKSEEISFSLDEGIQTCDYRKISAANKSTATRLLDSIQRTTRDAHWQRHKRWKEKYDIQKERNKVRPFMFNKILEKGI